jgi:hypothetical protein
MRVIRVVSSCALALVAVSCGPVPSTGNDGGTSQNVDGGTDKFIGTWHLSGTAQMPNGPNWPISFPMTVSKAGNGVDYQFADGDCVFTFTPQTSAAAPTLIADNTSCVPGPTATMVLNGNPQSFDRTITVTLTSATVVWSTVNGAPHLTVNGTGLATANGNTTSMTYSYDAVR